MVSHERNRIDGWWNFPERNTIDRDHKQQRRAPRSMSNGKHNTKSKALLGKEWRGKHSLQRNGTRVPKRSLDRAVVVIDRMTNACPGPRYRGTVLILLVAGGRKLSALIRPRPNLTLDQRSRRPMLQRAQAIWAREAVVVAAQDLNLGECGFRCPDCGLRHVIVDDRVLDLICAMTTFEVCPVCCPECGKQHEFTSDDLRFFDAAAA